MPERYAGIASEDIRAQVALEEGRDAPKVEKKPKQGKTLNCKKDEHPVYPKEGAPFCRKNRARMRRKIGPLEPSHDIPEMTDKQKLRHVQRRGELALKKLDKKKAEELAKTWMGKAQLAFQMWAKTQPTADVAQRVFEEVWGSTAAKDNPKTPEDERKVRKANKWVAKAAWGIAALGDNIPFPPVPAKGLMLVSLLSLPRNPRAALKGLGEGVGKVISDAISFLMGGGDSEQIKRLRQDEREDFLEEVRAGKHKKRAKWKRDEEGVYKRRRRRRRSSETPSITPLMAKEAEAKAVEYARRLKGHDPRMIRYALAVLVNDALARDGEGFSIERFMEIVPAALDLALARNEAA